MKKIGKAAVAFLVAVMLLHVAASDVGTNNAAAIVGFNAEFAAKVSTMNGKYKINNPVSSMVLHIGEDTMMVNGEEVQVPPPVLSDGEVLLPLKEIAKSVGADITCNPSDDIIITDDNRRTTIETEPDESIIVDTTPESSETEEETILPMVTSKQIEKALLVTIEQHDNEIIITKPFQTHQLVLQMENGKKLINKQGAIDFATDDAGLYLLQYATEEKTKLALAALEKNPEVALVSPNAVVGVEAMGSDGSFIGMPQMKSRLTAAGKTGSEFVVAVLDTGVDVSHPFLSGRLKLPGYNVIDGDTNVGDVDSHGTHVTGIIVDNTPANVKVMPVKVLNDQGQGTELDVYLGILYSVDNGAKVINMSLVGEHLPKNCAIAQGVAYATAKGVPCVAAAGNSHADTKNACPAGISEAITVSAIQTSYDVKADFSNYGNAIDIAAPGVSILSTIPGGGYTYQTGTSMAAPFVTAGAALLMMEKPRTSVQEVEAALKETTIDAGIQGWDKYYGAGVLNFKVLLNTGLVAPSSIRVNQQQINTEFSFSIEKSFQISVCVEPWNASNKAFSCTSSDPTVATYESGFITVSKAGSATVTFETVNGKRATCEVNVSESDHWIDFAASSYAGGNGTKANPFLISTAKQLAKIGYETEVNKKDYRNTYFAITNDIDLSAHKWNPIIITRDWGGTWSRFYPFEGHLDGRFHIIRNMKIDSTSPFVGLVGYMTGGSISNLGLENAEVVGPNLAGDVGILCGEAHGATFTNCYTTGRSTGAGFVGRLNSAFYLGNTVRSVVSNCYTTATVGVAGFAYDNNGFIKNSYAGGVLIDNQKDASGFTAKSSYGFADEYGYLMEPSVEVNCFSAVTIANGFGYKGLNGYTVPIGYAQVSSCYYLDSVAKGVMTYESTSTIDVKQQPFSFFINKQSYLETSNWDASSPWDFIKTWDVSPDINGGLPYLKGFHQKDIDEDEDVIASPSSFIVPATFDGIEQDNVAIDLLAETLLVPDDFKFYAYSVNAGASWKVGTPVVKGTISKFLDKGGELWLAETYIKATKTPAGDIYKFPAIQKRPPAIKLMPNFWAAHLTESGLNFTETTQNKWVLSLMNFDAVMVDRMIINESLDGKKPSESWIPMPVEGIAVKDLPENGKPKNTVYFYRQEPMIEEWGILPASKIMKVSVPTLQKPKAPKVDYKKEILKGAVGMGFSFMDGILDKYAAKTSIDINAITINGTQTSLLDVGSFTFWTAPTQRKPASPVVTYTLLSRAVLEDQALSVSRGKVTVDKSMEVFAATWGRMPTVTGASGTGFDVRLKATGKATSKIHYISDKWTLIDTEGAAASKIGSLTYTWDVYDVDKNLSGITSAKIEGWKDSP